jgi:superoxide dismutase, Fe-Mn family
MNAVPQILPFDPSQLPGLSESLIRSHHENNYTGAVRRLNAIRTELASVDFKALSNFQLNGLKREELIAANSMLLHELYFASLGGTPAGIPPPMAVALTANFGSVDRWKEEFIAMGQALSGGSGWVLLTFLPREGLLVNQWAADHTHALAGAIPILALDMYEHAYHIDYGARASAYIEAFMTNVRWGAVHQRYQQAVHDAAEPHGATQKDIDGVLLLDVRRAGAFEEATDLIQGAKWRDPALVSDWAQEFSSDQKMVVYCVAGHEMSRGTALRLRSAGLNAQFLVGGIEGWKASGKPTSPKSV